MRCTLTTSLLIVLTSCTHAQLSQADSLFLLTTEFTPPPDSLFVVDSIAVLGNRKTKEHVLLREMTLREGNLITREGMEYDKSRIYSLGLFTRVEMGYRTTEPPKATLVILVSERWYLYPFPLVGIKDRDWKKFYFGGGITHQNFRGRNEKLYLALILGYDPAVMFSYKNPLIDGDNNYFLSTGLAWRVVRNRSLLAGGPNFDERHFNVSVEVGKRIGIAHTVWVSGGYEIVKVSDYAAGRTISSSGTDAFPIFGAGYSYDTRDLEEYAMYGSFVRATLTKSGVPGQEIDFVRYALDCRRFVPITPRLTIAGRLFGDFAAGGLLATYSRVYLGYSERVRGHFSEIYEGEQQVGGSLELRLTVLQPRYITVDVIPIPEFAVWKFGIAAALFADAGTVWFRGQPFALNSFVRGYGVGIHFLLPYGFVLRTEYALNEVRRGEFILDFTAAF